MPDPADNIPTDTGISLHSLSVVTKDPQEAGVAKSGHTVRVAYLSNDTLERYLHNLDALLKRLEQEAQTAYQEQQEQAATLSDDDDDDELAASFTVISRDEYHAPAYITKLREFINNLRQSWLEMLKDKLVPRRKHFEVCSDNFSGKITRFVNSQLRMQKADENKLPEAALVELQKIQNNIATWFSDHADGKEAHPQFLKTYAAGTERIAEYEAAFAHVYRLLLGNWVPEVRVVYDADGNVAGSLSRGLMVPDITAAAENAPKVPYTSYREYSDKDSQKHRKFTVKELIRFGIARILFAGYLNAEDDCHKENYGPFGRLDFDMSGAPITKDKDLKGRRVVEILTFADPVYSFAVTREDIINFPLTKSYTPHYNGSDRSRYTQWLFGTDIPLEELANNEEFKQQKWAEALRFILIPKETFEKIAAAYIREGVGGEEHRAKFIEFYTKRQARLRQVLFSIKEFRQFARTKANIEKVRDELLATNELHDKPEMQALALKKQTLVDKCRGIWRDSYQNVFVGIIRSLSHQRSNLPDNAATKARLAEFIKLLGQKSLEYFGTIEEPNDQPNAKETITFIETIQDAIEAYQKDQHYSETTAPALEHLQKALSALATYDIKPEAVAEDEAEDEDVGAPLDPTQLGVVDSVLFEEAQRSQLQLAMKPILEDDEDAAAARKREVLRGLHEAQLDAPEIAVQAGQKQHVRQLPTARVDQLLFNTIIKWLRECPPAALKQAVISACKEYISPGIFSNRSKKEQAEAFIKDLEDNDSKLTKDDILRRVKTFLRIMKKAGSESGLLAWGAAKLRVWAYPDSHGTNAFNQCLMKSLYNYVLEAHKTGITLEVIFKDPRLVDVIEQIEHHDYPHLHPHKMQALSHALKRSLEEKYTARDQAAQVAQKAGDRPPARKAVVGYE